MLLLDILEETMVDEIKIMHPANTIPAKADSLFKLNFAFCLSAVIKGELLAVVDIFDCIKCDNIFSFRNGGNRCAVRVTGVV